jgi:hypothetical protein
MKPNSFTRAKILTCYRHRSTFKSKPIFCYYSKTLNLNDLIANYGKTHDLMWQWPEYEIIDHW